MAFEIPAKRKGYSVSYVRAIHYLPGKKIKLDHFCFKINSNSYKGLDVNHENYKHINKWNRKQKMPFSIILGMIQDILNMKLKRKIFTLLQICFSPFVFCLLICVSGVSKYIEVFTST